MDTVVHSTTNTSPCVIIECGKKTPRLVEFREGTSITIARFCRDCSSRFIPVFLRHQLKFVKR